MAIPPDLLAALGGGGGGGLPPDIMAALGTPAEAEVADAPMGSLHGGGAAEGDPEEFYRHALDDLEQGMKADVDEQRINTIMQCATKIQGELATSQKGQDAALGGTFDPSTMRRQSAASEAY